MPGDLWAPKRRIEKNYLRSLREVVDYLKEAIKDIQDPYDIVRVLRTAVNAPKFARYAEAASGMMVTQLFTDAGRTWRQAARVNSSGRAIYEALMKEMQSPVGGEVYRQIQRNAGIISTLPGGIADQVTEYIARETFKGRRASDIAAEIITMFPERTKAKAELIARTEVSKTSTALTRARAENIGLDWYEWRTSEDQRVRPSHELMAGVLVRWSDPPSPEKLSGGKKRASPYHAGEIYNCRCYPAPLISLDAVKWPHKVYTKGKIAMMTRAQFEKLAA